MAKKKIKGTYATEERSEIVSEILGKKPNWIVQLGTTVILIIVLLLFLGSMLIEYNDIVSTRVVITTKTPPVYLKTRTHGKLASVFIKPNQHVKKDQILAEIESTANIDDVLYLKERMEKFKPEAISLDSMRESFPPNLNLGPIQSSYSEFLHRYQNLILFNFLALKSKEHEIVERQLREQELLLQKQKSQLRLVREDLELSKKAHIRQKKLFDKGVISRSEYETASRALLADEQNYENFKVNISNTHIAIANFNRLLMQMTAEENEQNNDGVQQLENAGQNLSNSILQWEYLYLLKSPSNGRVTLFDIWNKNQNVTQDMVLFTVIPQEAKEIIGRVSIPLHNSGKVKNGQKAIIKLSNYPFREWGSLEGRIANISKVPKQKEKTYTAYLEIDSLKTSYGHKIEFRQEMQGTAEIVIEELSLLERILYEFRGIFERT